MSITWPNFLESYLTLRDTVFTFASRIVDMFQTPIGDLISAGPGWVNDIIGNLLPESVEQLTLLAFLTASLVPTFLVIYVVRMFVKN